MTVTSSRWRVRRRLWEAPYEKSVCVERPLSCTNDARKTHVEPAFARLGHAPITAVIATRAVALLCYKHASRARQPVAWMLPTLDIPLSILAKGPEAMGRTPLVTFSHHRWNFVRQRPQHVMTRLARWRPVLYVEEPTPSNAQPTLEIEYVAPNIQVVRAHLPQDVEGFHPSGHEIHRALLQDLIRQRGWRSVAAWTYTPMAVGLVRDLQPCAIVYDCMDERPAFNGPSADMARNERDLFACAHVVMTGGPSLFAAKRNHHANVHCLPSSVDVAHFSLAPNLREPDDQALIRRPRLGYFGVIDERMDLQVLDALARAHPEWQIVLVGPIVRIDAATLPQRPNLYYLGPRHYDELPSYLAGWDACLIPFAINASTRYISPTKTLEYMAGGRTIVSTPIRDIVDLYDQIAFIGEGADGFVAACERAMALTAEERIERRLRADKVLRSTSWDATAKQMEALLRRQADVRPTSPGTPATVPADSQLERVGV